MSHRGGPWELFCWRSTSDLRPWGWYDMGYGQPSRGRIVEACGDFDRILLLLWSPIGMKRTSQWCRGWLGRLLELWQSIIYDFEVDFWAITVVISTGPYSLPTDRSNASKV
jgi:hypothetical protein